MIRTTLFSAFVLLAALAGLLTPVRSRGEDGNQLPEKATRELSPELLSLLHQKHMPENSPIVIRIFKEEAELEVWKKDVTGHFELLKIYPVCRWSGDLGPKLHEGDRQTAEGFYTITSKLMNPNSNFYRAINIGVPNAFDKANETHLVRVDSQKNTLQWRGKTYRITIQPECGKFGWHVTGHGTSFDFCTATKGVAGFENQPKSVAEPIREGEGVGCSRFVND